MELVCRLENHFYLSKLTSQIVIIEILLAGTVELKWHSIFLQGQTGARCRVVDITNKRQAVACEAGVCESAARISVILSCPIMLPHHPTICFPISGKRCSPGHLHANSLR
jgi:hypothetical protein